MISIILLLIAGVLCAVMDTLEHHFDVSVFKNLDSTFWNRRYSWLNIYTLNDRFEITGRIKWSILGIKFNKLSFFCDAWHVAKSLMLWSICLAFYPLGWQYVLFTRVAFGAGFNLFYNHLLIQK